MRYRNEKKSYLWLVPVSLIGAVIAMGCVVVASERVVDWLFGP